ncbi:hypothetical protein C8J55DRAFT_118694 [Lentinula edodes]|uniref:Uncharacterized protein n=1 Tax=Lentinula lateritia TaxID=40482 RepID=A0A9W9DLS9_9AGAR|nr:hypothetical protein C8J55DRAFT_118694 [Lentinula edodes]
MSHKLHERLRKLYEEDVAVGPTRSERGTPAKARPVATSLILLSLRWDRGCLSAFLRALLDPEAGTRSLFACFLVLGWDVLEVAGSGSSPIVADLLRF